MTIWPIFSASVIFARSALTLDSMSAVSGLQAGGPDRPLLLAVLPLDELAPDDDVPLPLDELPLADPLLLPLLLLLTEPPPDDPLLDVLSPVDAGCDEQAPTMVAAIDSGTSATNTGAMRRQPAIRAIEGGVTRSVCGRNMRMPLRIASYQPS
jgi:hypothetical protein